MAKNNLEHILVIRLSAMGDVAMLVPVLSALSVSSPNIKITLLTKSHFAPIFNSFSNIDIVVADIKGKHKGFLGLYRLFNEIKQLGITSVADTHHVLRSNILKLFFKITGIPFIQIDKGRKEKAALTRTKQKDFKQLKITHERYADVFRKLGLTIDLTNAKPLPKSSLNNRIELVSGVKNGKWIGIAPFAAHEGKMYPIHLMKEVIKELVEHKGYTVLLFGGGASEIIQLDTIAQQYATSVINSAGKLSFEEELQLISNLDLMVSMDSGNGHLAVNYGIPVLTLWGVTHPYAGFAPFNQSEENLILANREAYPLIPTSIYGNKFPQGYENVMETILPKTVVQRILKIRS